MPFSGIRFDLGQFLLFAYICYDKVLCLLPCHFHRANQRFLCFSFVICSVFVAKEEKPENCNKLQQFHCI